MHEPLLSRLEEILEGRQDEAGLSAVNEHLTHCESCARELNELRQHSVLLQALRVPDVPEQAPGFYARVVGVVEGQARPSFWNLLLDPVFGRRLVYGSAAMVLLMATFLLASSSEQPELASAPVRIMVESPANVAGQMPTDFGSDIQRDREHFLVTMASFPQ